MKVNSYVVLEGEEFFFEVEAVMALFAVSTATTGPVREEELDKYVQNHCVGIKNTITFDSNTYVITEVFFRSNGCCLKSMQRQSDACYPDEETNAACRRLIRMHIVDIIQKITGCTPLPWGILRGVRPTKIVHGFLDKGFTPEATVERVTEAYGVMQEKAKLVTEIAIRQRTIFSNVLPDLRTPIGIYIGIPYCLSKCLYCSFPSYLLPDQDQVAVFFRCLQKDISAAAEIIKNYHLRVESIYIGGGTPTSLRAEEFVHLLDLVGNHLRTDIKTELSVEAGRPDSMDDRKLAALQQHGITRVSVNPQTMNEKTLKHIGRNHTVQDIIEMFANLRSIAVPVINMDIIAGLPGEDRNHMEHTMEKIQELRPDNLTVHTLAIKKGSRLKSDLLAEKECRLPDGRTTIGMVDLAAQYAAKMEMLPYYLYRQKYVSGSLENVGYALPGKECIYNIQVMEERQTIIGIGPGAATKAVQSKTLQLQRTYHAKDVQAYMKNLDIYLADRHSSLANCFSSEEE